MSCLSVIYAGIPCDITNITGDKQVVELTQNNNWLELRRACIDAFSLSQRCLLEFIDGETILQPPDFPITESKSLTLVLRPIIIRDLGVGYQAFREARSGPMDQSNYILSCDHPSYITLVKDFLDPEGQSFLDEIGERRIQTELLDLEECNGNFVFNQSNESTVQKQYELLQGCIFNYSDLNDLDEVYKNWVDKFHTAEGAQSWLLKIQINAEVVDLTKSILQAILVQKGKPLEERLVPLKTILETILTVVNDKTITCDPMLLAREIRTNMQHAFVGEVH